MVDDEPAPLPPPAGAGTAPAEAAEPAASRGVSWTARAAVAAKAVVWAASQGALDVVFPPACIACRRSVERGAGLCAACWRAMRFIERPYCERLGLPFPQDFGPGLLSPEAIANPPAYGRARAVARYDDGPARRLVHALKYGDRLDLGRPMGAWMARAGAELLAEADVIVPVPLHRTRLWRRQFNQAAVLAREVSRAAGVPWEPLALVRVKSTASQVGMTRLQRMDNVQGAFAVVPDRAGAVSGRRVLLVDDVLTTGSTLNAASRILLRAGAEAVDVLVFARVVVES